MYKLWHHWSNNDNNNNNKLELAFFFFSLFLVPPDIEPVLLPETLYAEDGKRTKIICSVTQGDPPIQITWHKNGRPLPLEKDLTLQNLEDSSLLIFRKTSSRHSGNYTCFASNAADTVNRTSRLVVNGKLKLSFYLWTFPRTIWNILWRCKAIFTKYSVKWFCLILNRYFHWLFFIILLRQKLFESQWFP